MSNLLTISYGDTETGPDMLEATLAILAKAGTVFEIETIQLGYELTRLGYDQGFSEDELRKIRCSRTLLKAPTKEDVTTNLRKALQINEARETYGENYAAQSFSNEEGYAIFEPSQPTAYSMLNAAIMALKHLEQTEIAERLEKILAENSFNENTTPDELANKVCAAL